MYFENAHLKRVSIVRSTDTFEYVKMGHDFEVLRLMDLPWGLLPELAGLGV